MKITIPVGQEDSKRFEWSGTLAPNFKADLWLDDSSIFIFEAILIGMIAGAWTVLLLWTIFCLYFAKTCRTKALIIVCGRRRQRRERKVTRSTSIIQGKLMIWLLCTTCCLEASQAWNHLEVMPDRNTNLALEHEGLLWNEGHQILQRELPFTPEQHRREMNFREDVAYLRTSVQPFYGTEFIWFLHFWESSPTWLLTFRRPTVLFTHMMDKIHRTWPHLQTREWELLWMNVLHSVIWDYNDLVFMVNLGGEMHTHVFETVAHDGLMVRAAVALGRLPQTPFLMNVIDVAGTVGCYSASSCQVFIGGEQISWNEGPFTLAQNAFFQIVRKDDLFDRTWRLLRDPTRAILGDPRQRKIKELLRPQVRPHLPHQKVFRIAQTLVMVLQEFHLPHNTFDFVIDRWEDLRTSVWQLLPIHDFWTTSTLLQGFDQVWCIPVFTVNVRCILLETIVDSDLSLTTDLKFTCVRNLLSYDDFFALASTLDCLPDDHCQVWCNSEEVSEGQFLEMNHGDFCSRSLHKQRRCPSLEPRSRSPRRIHTSGDEMDFTSSLQLTSFWRPSSTRIAWTVLLPPGNGPLVSFCPIVENYEPDGNYHQTMGLAADNVFIASFLEGFPGDTVNPFLRGVTDSRFQPITSSVGTREVSAVEGPSFENFEPPMEDLLCECDILNPDEVQLQIGLSAEVRPPDFEVNLIMYASLDLRIPLPRRDASTKINSWEDITKVIADTWGEFAPRKISAFFVTPQPEKLKHEGWTLVLLIAHSDFVRPHGLFLSLTEICHWEPDRLRQVIFRAQPLENDQTTPRWISQAGLQEDCKPSWEQHCIVLNQGHPAVDTAPQHAEDGGLITFLLEVIGEHPTTTEFFGTQPLFWSFYQNLLRDSAPRQGITVVSHGLREIDLGTRNFTTFRPDFMNPDKLQGMLQRSWPELRLVPARAYAARPSYPLVRDDGTFEIHIIMDFTRNPTRTIGLVENVKNNLFQCAQRDQKSLIKKTPLK